MTIAFNRGVLQCCAIIITRVVKENAFRLFIFYKSITFLLITRKVFITQLWFDYNIKAYENSFQTRGTMLYDQYFSSY